ncbi:MAG: Mrp/NBP35 family ATP-binding protein [Paludibacteraceae bacterium]|nr:Mrp/NBP35 family ATP-binding protein [Paludibacteraceae bacterium]
MLMYPQQIIDALRTVKYPGTGKDIVESGMLEDDIRISGFEVSFSLIFPSQQDPFQKSLLKAAETAIKTYVDPNAAVNIHSKYTKQTAPAKTEKPLPQVKNIIAVASGKGGVGKSTVTANLAIALASQGFSVGLLDADIHGPSIPRMFNVEDARPVSTDVDGRELIVPIEQYGVKMLSIGFFVDPNNAVVWRGGLASNAVKQLLLDADWGELDYLLIDMPPGTSDIHLTVVQTVELTGVVIVTTPQPVALIDARKGVDMFQNDKMGVPVLGIIENMSYFTPAELPENKYYIFGKDGGKRLAEELGVPFLGQIPLVQSIRQAADDGMPIALQAGHPATQIYQSIAQKLNI